MRAANEPNFPELELAITRFLEDFQSIITEHVQRALGKKPRARTPAAAAKGTAKGPGKSVLIAKAKATRARAKGSQRAEQLSLF
jgi:hypothetical protein